MSESGYVEVEGGRVYHEVHGGGDGVPLVCVHGGPGFPHDYLEPLGRLAADRPVLFYDQLGCGRSDRPVDDDLWRVDRFVRELEAVRRHVGFERFLLLGHSWGGCLAVTYLLSNRDAVVGLILASPLISVDRWLRDAAELRSRLPNDVRRVLDRHESDGATDCPEYVGATLTYYKRHFCRLDPWPDPLERTWTGAGLDVYVSMWGPTEFYATGTLRGYDLTDRLDEIASPTLFTCGRHDEATPESVAAFARRVPAADVVVFERSSHTAHLEEPDRYVEVVADFIARADSRA